jgi:hypothetical protein
VKRVVLLAQSDYAGSGYQVSRAINSVNGEFSARHISLSRHPWGFSSDIVIPCHCWSHPGAVASKLDNYALVMSLIEEADVINVWNNLPTHPDWSGIEIPLNKPIVVTMTGSEYRSDHQALNSAIKSNDWRIVVQNPMLRFLDEIDSTFIPHAVDTESLNPSYIRISGKITTYFNYGYNTSQEDRELFEKSISDKKEISWDKMAKAISHEEFLNRLETSDCYYHGIKISKIVGYVGRSGLEAMAMGIPVVTHVSESKCLELSDGKIGEHIPVLSSSEETLGNDLMKIIGDHEFSYDLESRARKWVEKYFSYEAVGRQYSKVYEEVLNGK